MLKQYYSPIQEIEKFLSGFFSNCYETIVQKLIIVLKFFLFVGIIMIFVPLIIFAMERGRRSSNSIFNSFLSCFGCGGRGEPPKDKNKKKKKESYIIEMQGPRIPPRKGKVDPRLYYGRDGLVPFYIGWDNRADINSPENQRYLADLERIKSEKL